MNHQKVIQCQQLQILREAQSHIKRADEMLDAVNRCVTESRGFPLYLTDLRGHVDVLMLLAAQFKALEDVRQELERKPTRKPKRRK